MDLSKRRIGTFGVFLAGFMALAMVAWGDVNGSGQTHESAALGFHIEAPANQGDPATGQLNYVADPSGPYAGFHAQCDDFSSYKYAQSTVNGYDKEVVHVKAVCQDLSDPAFCGPETTNGGVAGVIYLVGDFVDRNVSPSAGHDGTNIFWSCVKPVLKNILISDQGKITAGNINIHGNEPDPLIAEMLSE
jgi:hypothetical protein